MPNMYNQFISSSIKNAGITFIEGSFTIGATGAVAPSTAIVGSGITGVTRTGTGQYTIQLQDNFYRLLDFQATPFSPTSAAGITSDGSLSTGKPYQIVFPSTSTNWSVLGLPTGLAPVKGMPFVATSGASIGAVVGTPGTVIPLITSGVANFEVLPNPNLITYSLPTNLAGVSPANPTTGNSGGYVMIQTLNTSNAPANPTSGTVIRFNMTLRKSSLLGTNETVSNY